MQVLESTEIQSVLSCIHEGEKTILKAKYDGGKEKTEGRKRRRY